jgi:DNA-binding Xre family transcriptional regulator
MIRLRLREVLEQRKISQSRLSHMTFLSLNTIQEMVRDPTRDVRLSTIDKIAEALGVTVMDLYERIPDERRGG